MGQDASAGRSDNRSPARGSPGARSIALVGPFQSGKTTLLEAILARCGAIDRAGTVAAGNTVGDASPEARARAMSVEPNIAAASFLGQTFHFIDCPGSVEFQYDMRTILPGVDAAVVVCEADDRKLPALELVMRELEEADIPRFLFLNKIDTASRRVRETLASLQKASRTALLLRQIPIWKNGIAVGFIDLALERAFIYREHAPSEVVALPSDEAPREKEARFSMLEKLADYDDSLMESLLGDMEPPRDLVFDDLSRELRERHVVPVFIGAAQRGNGVTRLLKALRHEAPGIEATRVRNGVAAEGPPIAQVLRSVHTGHGGKVSVVRVLRGAMTEGDVGVSSAGAESRIGGVLDIKGADHKRRGPVQAGDLAGFARLDSVPTGDAFMLGKQRPPLITSSAPPAPVHAVVIAAKDRKDDVRLTGALAKLTDEDPSLVVEHRADLGEMRLGGQGEMHIKVALDRLQNRFGIAVATSAPQVGCRETVRGAAQAHGRHKKQSGGHGQFGDVQIELRPLPRGDGVRFVDRIHGGTVPRQYIPSVEAGVREFCEKGPLGHPLVDIEVTLTDGAYHTVDSSDMAFRQAARIAMGEAVMQARSVLLEPILSVEIATPSDALSKATALVTSRRGQLLGYDARPGWQGWEIIKAHIPEAEMGGLIVELRSATAGAGSFTAEFDHLAETAAKPAESAAARR
jgi:elongation factor G